MHLLNSQPNTHVIAGCPSMAHFSAAYFLFVQLKWIEHLREVEMTSNPNSIGGYSKDRTFLTKRGRNREYSQYVDIPAIIYLPAIPRPEPSDTCGSPPSASHLSTGHLCSHFQIKLMIPLHLSASPQPTGRILILFLKIMVELQGPSHDTLNSHRA